MAPPVPPPVPPPDPPVNRPPSMPPDPPMDEPPPDPAGPPLPPASLHAEIASSGHARRPSRVATRGSLRMVVGPGGKGLACERDPTIMRDRRAACQGFGGASLGLQSSCSCSTGWGLCAAGETSTRNCEQECEFELGMGEKPQRTQNAQKGWGCVRSCSCSCLTGWGLCAEGETSTRNCEQECDPEWTEASFASFAGRSPRRTTKPKAKSIRTRNG